MSKILYLAHPWSYNPFKSFKNAVNWTSQLRQKGKYVFSPILHTHPYWEFLMSNYELNYVENENWLDWDLKILEGFMNHDGHEYIHEHHECPKCKERLRWKHTRHECITCKCGITYNQHISFEGVSNDFKRIKESGIYYDSGVIVLMSNTAFERELIPHPLRNEGYLDEEWKLNFTSKGCEKEYNFAKSKFIRVLELEAFLEGKEMEL